MKGTKQQADRIEALLYEIGIYFVSPIEFTDGVITIHTGWCNEVKDSDRAMDIILALSDLNRSLNPDDLDRAVHKILDPE